MVKVREEVVISKSRVAVLIGKGGADRKRIAKLGRVSLNISSDGIVAVTGNPENVWVASAVVEAVGRGFSSADATLLFNKDYSFSLIYINEFVPKSKKRRIELRGRLIGTQGKIKHIIQKKTKTRISIYGKTVGIIGSSEGVNLARRAIESILRGAQYSTALGFLKTKED